jgi:hypothetical protein
VTPVTGGDDSGLVEDGTGFDVRGAACDVDGGSAGADGAGDGLDGTGAGDGSDGAGEDVATGGDTGLWRTCATATPPETRARAMMPATVADWAMVR